MTNNNYHQRIPAILEKKFVKYDEVAHALATGLASGKNVLLSGPGGHAKSEMIEAALRGLGLWDNVFLASFGEGLTTDELWGGINLDAMNLAKGACIEYHPERSFLNYDIAVFEEMLDAPSPVLLDLKDTLTRKEMRKGVQRHPMKTRVIIAATNHAPGTYADSDDPSDRARVALLERFPIQVHVGWDSYLMQDYLSMFRKHYLYGAVNGSAEKLAEILAEAYSQGHLISPRTAIHALEIVYNNALDRGHSKITNNDLADIRCLAGLGAFGEELIADIEQLSLMADNRAEIEAVRVEIQQLHTEFAAGSASAVNNMVIAKKAAQLKDKVLDIAVLDELLSTRQEIANMADNLHEEARDMAYDQINT
jgi:hypothetical protein